MRRFRHIDWSAYLIALLLVIVAGVCRFLLSEVGLGGLPFATFVPAVMLTSLIGGWGPGVLSVLLLLTVARVFPEPVGNARISDSGKFFALAISGVVNLMVVWLCAAVRKARKRVVLDAAAASRLATIVKTSDDAIISKSLHGVIQSWNDAATRLFGYTAEEIIGQSMAVLVPPERSGEEVAILARLRSGVPIDHYETVRLRKDGTRIDVSVTVSPLRDGNGVTVGASKIARDISERKAFERIQRDLLERTQAARQDAEKANRTKDEFLANLSHELRTPLNVILASVKLLQSPASDRSDLAEGLEVIERNARVQAQIVGDLLDMSRIAAGKIRMAFAPVSLADVVGAAVATAAIAAGAKNIAITQQFDPAVPLVPADGVRLLQVVWNLIFNAIKFTPDGGHVRVSVGAFGGTAEIVVRDDGEGISADFLPHVFERFRQADSTASRRHGGLGLGLSIVKHLVESHAGTVTAASEGVGRGSTFTVHLPLSRTEDAAAGTEARTAPTHLSLTQQPA